MSTLLWTLDAMKGAMGARLIGDKPEGIQGISIDTRTLQPGDAYFAIKGDVHDGHKFVANAHDTGAVISVVAEEMLDTLPDHVGPLLVVDSVLSAMEKLGVVSRSRSNAKIIAVTGSVGKTTTKEALRTALAACGSVHASAASYNNHWGVPLTLARMPQNTEFGVFEIGMNHPGEITPLVQMVRPHVAIINNVAAVHLGAFKNVDEIAKAKAEIFDGLEPGGAVVLNADDERIELLATAAQEKGVGNVVRFGEAFDADVKIEEVVLHGSCSCLKADILGTPMVVKVGAPGRHIVQNALAVLAAVNLVGADLARAGLALADMQPVKGRGQRHKLKLGDRAFVLIDESYNANPSSVQAALALLAAARTKGMGRHVAVLGDMLELGPTSADLHAGLAKTIKEHRIDRVFLAGSEMIALRDALAGIVSCSHAGSIDELIPMVHVDLQDGDVIMAKASLGMGFGRLIDDLLKTCESAS